MFTSVVPSEALVDRLDPAYFAPMPLQADAWLVR